MLNIANSAKNVQHTKKLNSKSYFKEDIKWLKKKQQRKKKIIRTKKVFFKDFKAELKKVIWPTPKQLVNNTVVVITLVLITAVIVFALDVLFETMNKHGVDKLKEVITSNTSETQNVSQEGNTVNTNNTESENAATENLANNTTESSNQTNQNATQNNAR